MATIAGKLLNYHRAFWKFDKWYRYSWLVWPQALTLAWTVMLFGQAAPALPPSAPWVQPTSGSGTPAPSVDVQLCVDARLELKLKGAARERAIQAGGLRPEVLASVYFGRAFVRGSENQLDLAIADYTEVLRLTPTDFKAITNRGVQYLAKSDLATALRDFDAALRIAPSDALTRANRAEALRRQAKLKDALAEVDKALELDPKIPFSHTVRERILTDLKQAGAGQATSTQISVTAPEKTPPSGNAATSQDYATCKSPTLPKAERVEGCSRAISGGKLDKNQLADAYYRRGYYHWQDDQNAPAEKDFDEAVKLYPDRPYYLIFRGSARSGLGENAKGLADVETALASNDKESAAFGWAWKSTILLRLGKQDEARTAASKAIELNASEVRGHLTLAEVSIARKQWEAAIREATTGLGVAPSNAMLLYHRGTGYLEMGQNALAIADLDQVIRNLPNFASAYNQRGRARLKGGEGQFDQALQDFTQAIRLAQKWAAPYANRALITEARKQDGSAISDLTTAIDLDPDNAQYLVRRAALYARDPEKLLINYDAAAIDLARAQKIEPDNGSLFLERGRALYLKISETKKYCDAHQKEFEERARQGYTPSTDIQCTLLPREYDRALADLRQAATRLPTAVDPLYLQGRVLEAAGRYREAVEALLAGHRIDPGNGNAIFFAGIIAFDHLKDSTRALEYFNEAIRVSPTRSAAFSNRANVYSSLPNGRDRAIADFRRAIELDRTDPYPRAGLKRLGARP